MTQTGCTWHRYGTNTVGIKEHTICDTDRKAHTSCTWHSNIHCIWHKQKNGTNTERSTQIKRLCTTQKQSSLFSIKKEKKKRKPTKTTHAENWLYLECFFKVVVFLQEHAIVHDNLWGSDAQVQDTVVHSFAWLQTQQSHKMPALSLLECHQ